MLHFKFWQFWQLRRVCGYPPFLCTETLSEPYLGLISGGVTPTPSAPKIHPQYTFLSPSSSIPGAIRSVGKCHDRAVVTKNAVVTRFHPLKMRLATTSRTQCNFFTAYAP